MITIIDYGAGNLFSIERAFRVLGADIHITNNKNDIRPRKLYCQE